MKAEFPVFEDRIATQHLVYLRLARLQDPAQLARVRCQLRRRRFRELTIHNQTAPTGCVQGARLLLQINFEQDVVISPENEYEILQLLMSDLRDRQDLACAFGLGPQYTISRSPARHAGSRPTPLSLMRM